MSEADRAPRRHVPFAPALRLGRILWRLLPWLVAGALVVAAAWLLGAADPLRRQAVVVALSLAAYALVAALLGEVLSPNREALRLFPMGDHRAQRLTATIRFLLFLILVTELGAWLVVENHWRLAVASALRVGRDLVIVLVIAGALAWSGLFQRMKGARGDTYRGLLALVAARFVFPFAVLTALFLVVVRGLGYEPLAAWVLGGALRSVGKLLLGVVLYRYLRRMLKNAVAFGQGATQQQPVEPDAATIGVERIGGGLLKLAVVLAVLFWVLAGWGLGPGTILDRLDDPLWASTELTWGTFVGGAAQVFAVLLLGWLLRNVLTFFVFPRAHVEVGARYAILAILRYAVVALAVVFGLQGLGMDTGSLGWFLGAAGIGLGFGLQDILGNFFSGLIMLLERPIRVGDVIQVGDAMGTVEEIRMRGTSIRTFDNTTVLIPNRQMLGERVTNLTYGLGHARLTIDIGVSYDSDVDRVRDLVLEVTRAHPDVLADPEPALVFSGYGDSALNFTLLCHTGQLRRRLGVASELRYQLFKRFREEGIEIPFPQMDLHVRSGVQGPPASGG
jgi:small-conductance mechanosensitive channel